MQVLPVPLMVTTEEEDHWEERNLELGEGSGFPPVPGGEESGR